MFSFLADVCSTEAPVGKTRSQRSQLGRSSLLPLGISALLIFSVSGCSDNGSDPVVVGGTPSSQLTGTLKVLPESFILTEGEGIALSANLGSTSLGPSQLTWSVSPSDVASIDTYGNLTALKHGEATVTARYTSISGTSMATVWAIPDAVEPAAALVLGGLVGRPTPDSIGVRAISAEGVPVPGVDVTFQLLSGAGALSHETQTTGRDGVARVEWTLGTTAGPQELHAQSPQLGDVTFMADAIPDYDSATVALVGGDGQEAVVTEVLPESLRAYVSDQFGNVLPGLAMDWTFSDGEALAGEANGAGSAILAYTDADGYTDITWKLGPEAGDQEAVCASPGADISAVSGGGASSSAPGATSGRNGSKSKKWKAKARPSDPAGVFVNPLQARTVVGVEKVLSAAVVDRFGNPIDGNSFTWEMDAAGAVDLVTSGPLEATVVGVKSGTSTLTARATGIPLSGSGTITVETRMPSTMAARSGNWQATQVGEAIPTPVSVLVLDQVGQPIPGIEVFWDVVAAQSGSAPHGPTGQPGSPSSVTDQDGVAQNTWILGTSAGVQKLRADLAGIEPVIFSANGTPADVAQLNVSPEGGEIDLGATIHFDVFAFDGFGNEVMEISPAWESSDQMVARHISDGSYRGLSAGTVQVTVTVGEVAEEVTLTVGSTPAIPLTLSGISPQEGPLTGNTQVTIRGSGFQASSSVFFGDTEALFVVFNSQSAITAMSPPGAEGAVDVIVWNPDSQVPEKLEGAFSYVADDPPAKAPEMAIGTATPSTGPSDGGSQIMIAGFGFEAGASVKFGGKDATQVIFYSSTAMSAITPGGTPGPVDIIIATSADVADTLRGAFSYLDGTPPPPTPITVTELSPVDGPTDGSTQVTITGTGFQEGVRVSFGGMEASPVTFHSETSISVSTPAGSEGTVDVVVSMDEVVGGTLPNAFTYIPEASGSPEFSLVSIYPNTGPESGGFPITITGEAFEEGATVTFGGTPATEVVVSSSTSIMATAPAGFPGHAQIVVTLPDLRNGIVPGGFTYNQVLAASNSIDLAVTRLNSGQGTVLVSNGIPQRQGAIMPNDLDNVRVMVNGVEQSVYVEALRGRHQDGSIRSLLVQFEYAVNPGSPVSGALEWGTEVTRTLPDRGRNTPGPTPSAVALPTDPNYLVSTGITLHPVLTEAQARAELNGTAMGHALDVFRTESDAHWDAFGADYLKTSHVYDRALNHFTFWAMTGEVKYWERAVANSLVARAGSTNTPLTNGVAPRFYQPDGMALHYLLTGDEVSIDYVVGGVVRMSLQAQHNPTNLARFGIPPEGYSYNEGRIRARVLLGTLWAWILEDNQADWGTRADQIVEGMIQGQNSDGSLTWRLGTDATAAQNLRYGQANYMEGLAMDAMIKYHILRNPDNRIVNYVQGMVEFMDNSEWSEANQAWHYWSPASAYDIGDSKVGLTYADELNAMITVGHYWADHMNGSTRNRARADQAFGKTFSSSGANFGIIWGRKVFNQAFFTGLAQMFYRQR